MKKENGHTHQLVTRLSSLICPEKRSVLRLGMLIFGVCALLGVSQASSIKSLFLGETSGTPTTQTRLSATSSSPAVASTTTTTTETEPVDVGAGAPTIVDLIADSETIINGMVKEVTDGFDNGVPYTQVTVQVSETLRGQVGEEYTFRQFGLVKPRQLDNGKVYLATTPAGWSK